jgi:hypothetical protein
MHPAKPTPRFIVAHGALLFATLTIVVSGLKFVESRARVSGAQPNGARAPASTVDCDAPFRGRENYIRDHFQEFSTYQRGRKHVRAALDAAMATVGASDGILKWMLTSLGKKGFPMSPTPPSAAVLSEAEEVFLWKRWFANSETGWDYATFPTDAVKKAIAPNMAQTDDYPDLPKPYSVSTKDLNVLRTHIVVALKALEEMERLVLKLVVLSEPSTIYTAIDSSVRSRTSTSSTPISTPPPPFDGESVRKEVIDEFADRRTKPTARRALAEKLSGHYLAQVIYSDFDRKYAATPELTDTEAQLKERYSKLHAQIMSVKYRVSSLWLSVLASMLTELQDKIVLSKPMIRTLESRVYAEANRKQASELFEELRTRINELAKKDLLPRSGLSEEKANYVLETFSRLQLRHPTEVPDDHFVVDPDTGLEILRREDTFTDPALSLPYDVLAMLSTSLEEFLSMNAFYRYSAFHRPEDDDAKVGTPEILYQPALLYFLSDTPELIREIFGHELGHHFGPGISIIRGHDLRKTYVPLFECFRNSFNLQWKQADESIADWISASVNGKRIAESGESPDRKIAMLEQLMTAYFIFDLQAARHDLNMQLSATHPASLIRIERIFGRNEEIMRAAGCSNRPLCTLDGGVTR